MNYKLYWELTNEGDARLLRAFGETPEPRFPAEIEGRAITAVSYTHLDVYKRQLYIVL